MNTIPVCTDHGASSRYAIIAALCEGSDTVLYRGVREDDGLPVVIKVLQRDHADARALRRLRHEHEVAAALDTPAIVKAYALGSVDGQATLILEDFGGRSLEPLLGEPMPLERFFPLALRLTDALAELHRHHVIHKDIKPQNLLYNAETGQVKITDLGLACLSPRESQDVAHHGLIEGTLAYMAPEQTGRMNRWIDERTDLYSLGVTFYEMLTGTLPFRASDPVGWVYCHIAQKPPPAHALVPSIPPLLSAVVLKLLSKAAEDRYQSALGLRRDLDECFARWRASGTIQHFPLGQRDLSDRFQIPQRLYGREREVEALLAVFERVVTQARPELVLVSGYSGIGKSSLVAELHRPVVRERGFFLSGKFDQLTRDIPYHAFLQAFRGLVQEILCVSEEELERWRRRLREALGPNGGLLAGVLPELELLLGPQPPAPELPAVEARHRVHATLQRFLAACVQKEHPMVLFLDDLQWADAASLQLLDQLISYAEAEHLLLIGAYRENEVGPAHPLSLMLADSRRRGAVISDIVLAPLSTSDVGALVAGAVHAGADQVEPLSRLVYEKTGGNPFFVLQFLLALHEEGLIAFDADEAAWRWDIAAIRGKGFSDNVVDLVVGKLKRLSASTQDALKLAACLGSSLILDTLAAVAKRPAAELRDALEEAVREGLLLRRDGGYRFLHDRVQQAAHALIPAAQLAEVHLCIGRLLLKGRSAGEREEALFDIVGHLNRGAALIRSPAERGDLAALNLRAGRRARAAAAHESAAALFAAGMALLGEDRWETQYQLTYDLSLERAHSAYITGSFEEAERLLEELMDRARTKIETAAVVELAAAVAQTRGQCARAVEIGLSWLRACDIDLPLHPSGARIEEETKSVWQALRDRPIEDLIRLPPMTHPEIKVVMDVLQVVAGPAIFVDPDLHYLLVMRMVKLSLRHGNAESSALAYAAFARLIGPTFGRYQEAYLFGKLGYALADGSGSLTTKSTVFTLFGQIVVFWTHHYRETYPYTRAGFSAAAESGHVNMACLNCVWAALFPLLCGEPLEDVLHEVEERLGFVRRAGYAFAHSALVGGHAMIQTLRGRPVHFPMLDGSDPGRSAFEARLKEGDLQGARGLYYSLEAQALFVLGSPREALAAATRVTVEHPWRTEPYAPIAENVYYLALALATLGDEAQPSPLGALPAQLLECERQLGAWARNGPDNFLHKHALVRAEIARLRGQDLEAIRLYEQAIAAAREGGFVQHEAIACELAAAFYRARGLSTAADAYLQKARAGFFRWGAHAKVEQLDQRYPHLAPRKPIAPTVTFAVRAEQFDVLPVVKASQRISGELELPRLLEMLLRLVVEHAGAEEGYVLLVREDRLWAAAIEAPGGAARLLDAGEASSAALPQSVLNYVRRSHERVLLDDAAARHPFMEDEYFGHKRPRSVLCLPIMREARLIGLLYLENNLVTGAFTPARLSVIELLASQSAISLENALLYADLEQENAERRRAEQALKASEQAERFLAEASRNLMALGYSATLESVAQLAVPELADQCVIDVDLARGAPGHAVVTAGVSAELADAVVDAPRPLAAASLDRPEVGDIRAAPLLQRLDIHAFLRVPLVARDRCFGVMTLLSTTPRRPYGPADLRLAEELGHRAALALDNARLFADAQEAIARREEFLVVASHELKTPLTSLQLQAQRVELLLRRYQRAELAPERIEGALRVFNRQLARLGHLVNELLDVTRLNAGRLTLTRAPVDLAALAREVVDRMSQQLADARCGVQLELDEPVIGRWDPSRVEQVLINLLSNAMKYGAGRPVLVRVRRQADRALLVVRDQGIGIAEADQRRIFERFERAASVRNFGGLGLGLYIVRSIVASHGGSIRVESKPGAGATFVVELPLSPPKAEERGAAPA